MNKVMKSLFFLLAVFVVYMVIAPRLPKKEKPYTPPTVRHTPQPTEVTQVTNESTGPVQPTRAQMIDISVKVQQAIRKIAYNDMNRLSGKTSLYEQDKTQQLASFWLDAPMTRYEHAHGSFWRLEYKKENKFNIVEIAVTSEFGRLTWRITEVGPLQ